MPRRNAPFESDDGRPTSPSTSPSAKKGRRFGDRRRWIDSARAASSSNKSPRSSPAPSEHPDWRVTSSERHLPSSTAQTGCPPQGPHRRARSGAGVRKPAQGDVRRRQLGVEGDQAPQRQTALLRFRLVDGTPQRLGDELREAQGTGLGRLSHLLSESAFEPERHSNVALLPRFRPRLLNSRLARSTNAWRAPRRVGHGRSLSADVLVGRFPPAS
jgi:hypothetical protein